MRFATFPMGCLAAAAFCALALGSVAGCADDELAPQAPAAQGQTQSIEDYQLGAGDKVRIIVYGEDDLGGEYQVDGGGQIRLPLIGQVDAGGQSIHQLENDIKTKLDNGYLKDARVSAEVINYRPFYIIGEVNKPGEYPYVSGMTVLNAVALAGGYTYRANDTDVYIRRNGSTDEISMPADQSTKINPGDFIRVRERFF